MFWHTVLQFVEWIGVASSGVFYGRVMAPGAEERLREAVRGCRRQPK